MMRLLVAFIIGFVLMLTFLIDSEIISKARSADLAIPLLRKMSEPCSGPDVTPAMRQIQVPDASCPTGFRWKNTK